MVLKPLLIIASSGRMLAEAAKNAGYRSWVIDLYADQDTGRYAEMLVQVSSLAVEDIAAIVDDWLIRYSIRAVIYGSGLENHPETLSFLHNRLTVLGNAPRVFEKIHDKVFFFKQLKQLAIPYPELTFSVPATADGWLFKPMRGQGGLGIGCYDPKITPHVAGYWQKYQRGESYSVLFIADGVNYQLIGFHQQWTINLGAGREFIFSGIRRCYSLSDAAQLEVACWLGKLVPAFALKGLNALDFMAVAGRLQILEINPRPSASMQLYAADLLTQHVSACQGKLTAVDQTQEVYKAYQIIYAQQRVQIPKHFEWPVECRDLPNSGAIISAGQPICSMIASASSVQLLKVTLQKQQHILLNQLHKGS